MTVNLIHINKNADNVEVNWASLTAISKDAFIEIDDATVTAVAKIVSGKKTLTGLILEGYAIEDDDCMTSFVPSFGPSVLAKEDQDEIRTALTAGKNGDVAVAMFDKIIELGVQVGLSGSEMTPAHMNAVNWPADDVEINRCAGNMIEMMNDLDLDLPEGKEIEFDKFAKAVEENGYFTDRQAQLEAFVACARRNNATHVYWA